MPPRNEQEQRRQQIIGGALTVFAAKGFDRASNRDIAAAAQIGSPGLIYHYFRDKADLLHQAIRSRLPAIWLLETTTQAEVAAPGADDPPMETVLLQFALAFATVLADEQNLILWKVLLTEAVHNPQIAGMVNEALPGYSLHILAGYLEEQMTAGRLRRMDPYIAALSFVGPLLAYMATRYLFQQPESKAITPEAMACSTVETFLRALAPEPRGVSVLS